MANDIVVIDYGVGNVGSVLGLLEAIGCDSIISNNSAQIHAAKMLILPGVGAFHQAMKNIEASELLPELIKFKATGRPILGICLGMQILAESSEEFGYCEGLGWIPGSVKHLSKLHSHRVPNIGWSLCELSDTAPGNVWNNYVNDYFYFDHSYFFDAEDEVIISHTHIGSSVPAVVRHENIIGIQFHPEKSQLAGRKLICKVMDEFKIERDPLWL